MRSPVRWVTRYVERSRQATRRCQLEAELAAEWQCRVKLRPASAKGGYDEIYYAIHKRRRIAVVRVNNPHKHVDDPIGPEDPGVPLGSNDRLDCEWKAYGKLYPQRLSPEPMWRTHDAIACSWLNWNRASQWLTKHRDQFWPTLEQIIPAIRRMHDLDVIHLDLNLGNILLEPGGAGVVIIDFEFGPVDWVSKAQQMAFDYLRLIDDCIRPRRGGAVMLDDPKRLVELLDTIVVPQAKEAEMRFSLSKLKRLGKERRFCEQLRAVFARM